MATSYPTGLDTFTNPASSDLLSAGTGHAAQHDNINDAVAALEAKVGINSSAVTTSLDFKINHIVSANPGTYFPQAGVISNIDRNMASSTNTISNQNPPVFGFVAPAGLTCGHVTFYVTTIDAAVTNATVTLFTVAANGDLTIIAGAVTANIASSVNASTGTKTVALGTPAVLTAGTAYAVCLWTTGGGPTLAAAPALQAVIITPAVTQPFPQARFTSQAVTPTSIAFSSLTKAASGLIYFEFSA